MTRYKDMKKVLTFGSWETFFEDKLLRDARHIALSILFFKASMMSLLKEAGRPEMVVGW